MRFDGMDFKRANHLYFRHSQEGDLNEHGHQLAPGEIAFVYLKDCEVERDEYLGHITKVIDAKCAPAIKGGHSLSNMMYGKARKRHNPFLTYVWDYKKREHVMTDTYYTVPVYLAYRGYVYTSTIRHLHNPDERKK